MTNEEYVYGYRVLGEEFWPTDYGPDGIWIGRHVALGLDEVDFTWARTDEEKLAEVRGVTSKCDHPVTILRKHVITSFGPVEEVL